MGNSNSTDNNNNSNCPVVMIPTRFSQCMRNGVVDNQLYYLYRRRKRQKQQTEEQDDFIGDSILQEAQDNVVDAIAATRPPRTCFRRNLNLCRATDGTLVELGPRTSSWYCTYIQYPAVDDIKFQTRFRRRFRCSYKSFNNLLDLVKEDDLFSRWQRFDAAGRMSSPIELLLLGTLRYIGRGWTFNDLEENTSISEETHRQFFIALLIGDLPH
jgi:hypothetical protein